MLGLQLIHISKRGHRSMVSTVHQPEWRSLFTGIHADLATTQGIAAGGWRYSNATVFRLPNLWIYVSIAAHAKRSSEPKLFKSVSFGINFMFVNRLSMYSFVSFYIHYRAHSLLHIDFSPKYVKIIYGYGTTFFSSVPCLLSQPVVISIFLNLGYTGWYIHVTY